MVVGCVTSSKDRRKRYVPRVVLRHLLMASVAKVHDEILLVWLWALYSTSRVTHRVSCWPEVELSDTDGLPGERDILEASPPLSAVLHSAWISQKQSFCERCWFFNCTLVFHTSLVALWIRELAGLVVKIHICESCTWRGSSREVSKVLKLAKGLFFQLWEAFRLLLKDGCV